jgi:hypothetical protein
MGQELQRRTSGPLSRQPEPSWSAVAGTTMRLWLQRHHIVGQSPAGRRRRLIVVLSALVAMAFGAGVTLAFTSTSQHAATPPRPKGASALQVATENRHDAAVWVASQVSQSVMTPRCALSCKAPAFLQLS